MNYDRSIKNGKNQPIERFFVDRIKTYLTNVIKLKGEFNFFIFKIQAIRQNLKV